jgi:hypothetical protein
MDVTRTVWFSYAHVLTASLALFADLFYCIDHGVPDAELDEKRCVNDRSRTHSFAHTLGLLGSQFLVRATSVFATHETQNNVIMRNIGQQGAKCIS